MKITKKQAKEISNKLGENFESISFLGRGAHNENHILETSNGKYVIRISMVGWKQRLKQEYKMLKQAKGKFGPKAYFIDSSEKIITKEYFVEDYIEGEKAPQKADKKLMKDVANTLKKLHSISRKPVKKEDILFQSLSKHFDKRIKEYKNLREELVKSKKPEYLKETDKIFEETKKACKENDKTLNNRKNKHLIHGNIDPEHIIYTKKGIKFIDWEFSRYGLPESDLTFFAYLYDLDDKQLSYFLEQYGYPSGKTGRKKFNLLMVLHHVGLINWVLERIKELRAGKIYKNMNASNMAVLFEELEIHLKDGNRFLEKVLNK